MGQRDWLRGRTFLRLWGADFAGKNRLERIVGVDFEVGSRIVIYPQKIIRLGKIRIPVADTIATRAGR